MHGLRKPAVNILHIKLVRVDFFFFFLNKQSVVWSAVEAETLSTKQKKKLPFVNKTVFICILDLFQTELRNRLRGTNLGRSIFYILNVDLKAHSKSQTKYKYSEHFSLR